MALPGSNPGRLLLLHPVVVTAEGRLVAGHRRLEAVRSLGWPDVEVTVATQLGEAKALLLAEVEENVCRKDMSPSEKVALGAALEELERPKADARKAASQFVGPATQRGAGNFPAPRRGDVRDLVGGAVGMSGPTYSRAKAVVQMAATQAQPGVGKTGAGNFPAPVRREASKAPPGRARRPACRKLSGTLGRCPCREGLRPCRAPLRKSFPQWAPRAPPRCCGLRPVTSSGRRSAARSLLEQGRRGGGLGQRVVDCRPLHLTSTQLVLRPVRGGPGPSPSPFDRLCVAGREALPLRRSGRVRRAGGPPPRGSTVVRDLQKL